MNEIREQYKAIVLEACRIAVKGGFMSVAYEDFVIDNIDAIVDSLTDAEFDYLLRHGKIPAREITNDEEYNRILGWNESAFSAIQKGNMETFEVERMQSYTGTIENLKNEYKSREWDF